MAMAKKTIKKKAFLKPTGTKSSNVIGEGVKRTAAEASAEKKAISKYIKQLKADSRTKWEIITDDPDYVLILRAPLDDDLSSYAEYGWAGPFKYLEEVYAESGHFSFRPDIERFPIGNLG